MKRSAALALCFLVAGVAAQPVDYQLTPTHSFVHFELEHLGLSTTRGRFDRCSGRVTLDRQARRGTAEISLRLDSVNTGTPTLDRTLRRALGAEAEARASIIVDAMNFDGERVRSARGTFHLAGTQTPIELRAERFNCYLNPLLLRQVCGGDFEATLELQALGLQLDPELGLGGRLRLHVQVEAIRQSAEP